MLVRGDIPLRRLSFFTEDDFGWSKERANSRSMIAFASGHHYPFRDFGPRRVLTSVAVSKHLRLHASLTSVRDQLPGGPQAQRAWLRIVLSQRLFKNVIFPKREQRGWTCAGKNADGFRISPGSS